MRFGISNNQLTAALIAGFFATHIATITGFWYEIVNLPATDWNRFNGTYLVGFGNPTAVGFGVPPASDFEVFLTGWTFHVLTGLGLTLIFAFGIRPMIPLAYDKMGNILAALAFGLALAVLSFTILTPVLDPYNADPGWFSLDLKLPDTNDVAGSLHPGWKTTLSIIVWHIIYGVHLGLFYQPKDDGTAAT
ncbi:MAG TPA: hypothetical protein VFS30_16345 [Dehalococcoidia bacterium]|nr:hypothetical protein [Dehalococcoidia bacterium]